MPTVIAGQVPEGNCIIEAIEIRSLIHEMRFY